MYILIILFIIYYIKEEKVILLIIKYLEMKIISLFVLMFDFLVVYLVRMLY
mgnify:FL=1|jgi:hypothetical protein